MTTRSSFVFRIGLEAWICGVRVDNCMKQQKTIALVFKYEFLNLKLNSS